MHRACGVIDTVYILHFFAYHRCFAFDFHFSKLFKKICVHAVSMTPHAFKKNSNIFANSNLYSKRLKPLNQEPRTDVLMKKKEGRKSRDTVPLRFII
jgi:hypothetical protein